MDDTVDEADAPVAPPPVAQAPVPSFTVLAAPATPESRYAHRLKGVGSLPEIERRMSRTRIRASHIEGPEEYEMAWREAGTQRVRQRGACA